MKTRGLTGGLREKLRAVDLAAAGEYAVRFVLAFLLSQARIFGRIAPFGVAFAGAPAPSAGSLAAMLGACLGYMTGGAYWGVKYIAAIVIIRAAVRVLYETDLGRRRFFCPAVTAASMACTGFVYVLDGGLTAYSAALFVIETTLAGGCAYFYGEVLYPWEEAPWKPAPRAGRDVSAVLLLTTLLIAAAGVYVTGGVSVGRALAVLLVMLASFRGGVGRGAAAGAILGAAMDLVSGTAPFFIAVYALSALVAGVFPKSGRVFFDVTFIMTDALAVVWMWGAAVCLPALYETFLASVVFLLLPDTALAKVSAVFPAELNGYGFLKAREYTKNRTQMAARAFRRLYETVRTAAGDDEKSSPDDISAVYDRAAERVCRRCSRAGACWQTEYRDTVDIMNHLTPGLLARGEVRKEDFPPRFYDKCKSFDAYLEAINTEARVFLCRRQYRRRISESRGAAYNQYGDIAVMLDRIAAELGEEITVEPVLEKRVVKFMRGLDIEVSAAAFRLPGGRLRVELKGPALYTLKKEKDWLAHLSALMETKLCAVWDKGEPERLLLTEAEPYAAALGASAMGKNGRGVNGDKGVWFRTEEGVMYVLLSDGMGSGAGAAKLSSAAAEILESFLRAGTEPETALGILGDLLFLENDAQIVSATVDLMRVDLFSGDMRIYKYGAAPSYFKRETSVKRVSCAALPTGLVSGREKHRCAAGRLAPGSFAVMVSDGILGEGNDKWLRELLGGYDGRDPQELSRLILQGAAERYGAADDMTAIVMRLDARA